MHNENNVGEVFVNSANIMVHSKLLTYTVFVVVHLRHAFAV